jgi:GNAT superfamily N-acetyltransferase
VDQVTVLALELRPMTEGDRHYVLSSWLRSYAAKGRDSRDYGERHSQFCDDYAPIVRALLERSKVLVAGLAETPDVICGWMAWEGDTLHYVLTKPNFRRLGVASWMLADFASMPVAFTHRTSDAGRCPIPEGWAYRRYRIWPPEEKAA